MNEIIDKKAVKKKKPMNLPEMIERTGYPTDQRTNSSGYEGNYADPFANIDAMIRRYTEDVVAIKRYALEKSLVNIQWALKNPGRKEGYYKWCQDKLKALQTEYDKLNEKYPLLKVADV